MAEGPFSGPRSQCGHKRSVNRLGGRRSGLLAGSVEQVPAGPQRHGRVVAQPRDHERILAPGDQDRRVAVPEVVEPDPRQAEGVSRLEERPGEAADIVRRASP